MFDLSKIQEAIRRESLGGWLFSTLRNRDSLSLSILDLPPASKNTRPWYYFIFAREEPLKIVPAIESDVLADLPGEIRTYRSRAELLSLLQDPVEGRLAGRFLACQYSADLPVISFLDHGTVLLLESAGLRPVSSASLIQRFRGILDPEETALHETAAKELYDIVRTVWSDLKYSLENGTAVYEGGMQDGIMREFELRGLETDHPPTVAAGSNSGNPHYSLAGRGRKIEREEVLQLDLWAKRKAPGSVYADISWVGFTGAVPPERVRHDFAILAGARDSAVEFIASGMTGKTRPSGADVDRHVRRLLALAGYENALRHRTGHGIDREVHGSGVNLDSVEFPDNRLLLDGACFSVEPGLYFSDYGLRTEINVIIKNGIPLVTGGDPQRSLLTF